MEHEEELHKYNMLIRKTDLKKIFYATKPADEYYSVFFDCKNCDHQSAVFDSHMSLPELVKFISSPAKNPIKVRIAELEVELETLRAQLKE